MRYRYRSITFSLMATMRSMRLPLIGRSGVTDSRPVESSLYTMFFCRRVSPKRPNLAATSTFACTSAMIGVSKSSTGKTSLAVLRKI